MVQKFDFSIDWLEFTYKVPLQFTPKEESEGVQTLNGMDVFENFKKDFPEIMKDWEINTDQVVLLAKGRNFYNTVYSFSDDYTVCYHSDKRQMGVHVTFPGHGIYKISEIFGLGDLNEHEAARKIFKILDERNCEITRLDLAYDDYTKTFRPKDFMVFMSEERITTESRVWSYIASARNNGDTFYLGKRGRDRFLRIYDKAYESDGKIDAIRYEFELKKDWARVVQNHVMNDKVFCFADLLDSMFIIKEDWGFNGEYDTFIDRKGDKAETLSKADAMKKSRAGIDEKWQLFLDTMRQVFAKSMCSVVEISLKKEKEEYSYKRTYEWLRDYILPSLFIFRQTCSQQEFDEFIASGEDKLKPEKKRLINRYIMEKAHLLDPYILA